MSEAFLSYNSLDRDAVAGVEARLRAENLHTFLDRAQIYAGDDSITALVNALGRAEAVLIFIGPHGQGPWQRREINLAVFRQRAKPSLLLIPVYLPGSVPVFSILSDQSYIDLRENSEAEYARLIDTLRMRAQSTRPPLKACPYRKLASYAEHESALFHGRQTEIQQLADVVNGAACTFLVGPSGIGKSSLIRAGLTPRLETAPGATWLVAYCRPSREPFRQLAKAFLRLMSPHQSEVDLFEQSHKLASKLVDPKWQARDCANALLELIKFPERNLLLVVDQFEDLDQVESTARERFHAVLHGFFGTRVRLLLGLRSGFYDIIEQFEEGFEGRSSAVYRLLPMEQKQLKLAIKEPARRMGVTLEAGLTKQLLADASQSVGALPLLAVTLTQLWETQEEGVIKTDQYVARGGISKVISVQAEDAMTRSCAPLEECKRTLLKLVDITEGRGTLTIRARVSGKDLREGELQILRPFVDAGLVTVDDADEQAIYEFAHDEVIRSWARLHKWVTEATPMLLPRSAIRRILSSPNAGNLSLGSGLLDQSRELLLTDPGWLSLDETLHLRQALRERFWSKAALRGALAAVLAVAVAIALIMYERNRELKRDSWIVRAQEHLEKAGQLWPPSEKLSADYTHWLAVATALYQEQECFPSVNDSRQARLRELADKLVKQSVSITARIKRVDQMKAEAEKAAVLWQEVIADVAPKFILPRVEGVIPLRKNDTTGLWEFWHVLSGERPKLEGQDFRMTEVSGMVLVLLMPGTFSMGSERSTVPTDPKDESGPNGHPFPVTIHRPFFISKFETTQAQARRASGVNPSFFTRNSGNEKFKDCDGTYPVEQITHDEATEICAHWDLSLPSEQEWEFAARAGTTTKWWTGDGEDKLGNAGNFADETFAKSGRPPEPEHGPSQPTLNDGYEYTAPVGAFRPNAFGLYDTIGNVWEWTRTDYSPYGQDPASHDYKVIRGGSWGTGIAHCRSASRNRYQPHFRFYSCGFRAAKGIPE